MRKVFVRPRSLAAVAALLAFGVATARAQPTEGKAAAEALFDQGKKLMAAGNTTAACPKFEESLRAAPGLGTMLWLADCYEASGRTASAWAQFREAAGFAAERGDPREKVARKRAATLEPKLAKLTVVVGPERPPGLEVKRDGVVVKEGAWSTEVPVDPGDHRIAASAPKHKDWEQIVKVPAGAGLTQVTVPALETIAEPTPPKPPTPPPPPENAEPPPPASTGGTQRILGLVVAGAGVVGIGVGAIFGLKAKSQLDDSNDGHCNANGVCDEAGLQGRVDALNSATISTIGFLAGGVLAAGGAVIYFTAPSSPKTTGLAVSPTLGASGGGVTLRGAW